MKNSRQILGYQGIKGTPAKSVSILQPIPGLEEPGSDRHAQREKAKRHGNAQSDMHVGDIEKAPAEARDQIDQRVEQRDRAPERRQYARWIKGPAEERQRRDDQERHDLQ